MLKLPNDENAEGAKHFLQEIPDKNSHLGDRSELFFLPFFLTYISQIFKKKKSSVS